MDSLWNAYVTWQEHTVIYFVLWIKGSHRSPNFKAFECSGKNLPKLSCHFLNHKSLFLQIFHHSRVSWKITLLHFFCASIIYFGQKEPIKCKFLRLSSARVKFVKFLMSISKRQVNSYSSFSSFSGVFTHNSSIKF